MENKLPTLVDTTVYVIFVLQITSQIIREPVSHDIEELSSQGHTGPFPTEVLFFSIPKQRKFKKTIQIARQILDHALGLDSGNLWLRRLNPVPLTLSMIIKEFDSENEFGPGIYAADNYDKAALYAWISGAIMVFKNPEFQDISMWERIAADWRVLSTIWLQIQLPNFQIPDEQKARDYHRGNISRSKRSPEEEATQMVRSKLPVSVMRVASAFQRPWLK